MNETDYKPKHLARKPYLSQMARERLKDLSSGNPWAAEGINRAVERMIALEQRADNAVDDMTMEDVVNYYDSEIQAMIICMMDLLPAPEEYLDIVKTNLEDVCR